MQKLVQGKLMDAGIQYMDAAKLESASEADLRKRGLGVYAGRAVAAAMLIPTAVVGVNVGQNIIEGMKDAPQDPGSPTVIKHDENNLQQQNHQPLEEGNTTVEYTVPSP